MQKYDVIIVGAGIAGMTAASDGAMAASEAVNYLG